MRHHARTTTTATALLLWAMPAWATRHGGEINIVGIFAMLLALPVILPLVPLACGLALHAAFRRRWWPAVVIAAGAGVAVWGTVHGLLAKPVDLQTVVPAALGGSVVAMAVWFFAVVRRLQPPEKGEVLFRAAIGWVVCFGVTLTVLARAIAG